MPLDGLRAWIGEVERKLGMRTRVFLALATIAIGGAGAAIYLSLDTRDDAVSESDVQALQERLEQRVAAGGATGTVTDTAQLEAELNALEAEVDQLRGEPGAGDGKGAAGPGGIGSATDGDETADEESPAKSRLRDLLEQAKEQSEAAEGEQAP
jgi:hypothetical protein